MVRKKCVLVVVAHADDLEFMAGGTVARFVDECGYQVYEYILTDNAKGSYRLSMEELVAVSAKEAVEAGRILGLQEVRLEGYTDGCLNEENPNVLRDKIIAMIREVKADVVMSWDPWAPNEDHPDHRSVGMATFEAASFSGNPMFVPEDPHPTYKTTEAYWFAKSPVDAADHYVDVSAVMDKKVEALLAHDCQMALTFDLLAQEAEVLGLDLPMFRGVGKDEYRPLIDVGIRSFCEETGKAVGYAFAERFRYQKLTMLDVFLGMDLVQPDF